MFWLTVLLMTLTYVFQWDLMTQELSMLWSTAASPGIFFLISNSKPGNAFISSPPSDPTQPVSGSWNLSARLALELQGDWKLEVSSARMQRTETKANVMAPSQVELFSFWDIFDADDYIVFSTVSTCCSERSRMDRVRVREHRTSGAAEGWRHSSWISVRIICW